SARRGVREVGHGGSTGWQQENRCPNWRECSLSCRRDSYLVECRGRAVGVNWPGNSGCRFGPLPPGSLRRCQCKCVREAVDLLPRPRVVAAPAYPGSDDASTGDSANNLSSGAAGGTHFGEVSGNNLARLPRGVYWCSSG